MTDFVIISRDCHGNQYYKKEYNTPTIGNCMVLQDFILFCNNIEEIQYSKLIFDDTYQKFDKKTDYPIGKIDIKNKFVHIHFFHDKCKDEILNKYYRRIDRMKKSKNYYFFLNDLDLDKSGDNNYADYFNINDQELIKNLIDYFLIKYGKKIFFCKKRTYDKVIEHTKDYLDSNNKIIIIPDKIKTGGEIYNFVKQTKKEKEIFHL